MASKNQPEPKDALLQEVDADLRAEKMAALWQQWKQPLLVAVIALVVGTGVNSVWQSYREKQAQANFTRLDAALETLQNGGRVDAAKQFNALAADTSGEVHDLAQLWEARSYEAMGQTDKAIPVLKEVAQSSSGDLIWRDIACLRLMGLSDDIPENCTSADNSPLAASRDEWRAGQLWKEGKIKEARALLAVLANSESDTLPRSQRDRAANLLTIISAPGAK